VSVALLVCPLVELETGWDVELDALPAAVLAASAVDEVAAAVVVGAAVVPDAAVVVCGSGVPANVTTPKRSANEARVAAATRRWMRFLKVFPGVEGMQASCARGLSRRSALPGRILSVSRALAR